MVNFKQKNESSQQKDPSKKLISIKNFKVFNQLIKDEASVSGESESAVVERNVLSNFFSKADEMRDSVLYTVAEENAVTEMCRSVFSYFAAMPGNAQSETMIPLLDQCFKMSFRQTVVITKKIQCIYHFRSQLDSVYSFFKECEEKHVICNGKEFNDVDCLTKDFFKMLLDDVDLVLEGKREQVVWQGGELGTLISYIRSYFDFAQQPNSKSFGQWSITYRLLLDLAEIAQWENSAINRYNLVKIIKNIDVSEQENDSFNPKFVSLSKYTFINGKTILTTDDAIVLKTNPSLDEKEFKNAERIIHGPNGRKTEHPMIVLYNDESPSELQDKVTALVKDYFTEFPNPKDAFSVSILDFGKYLDPRIQWFKV